MKKILLLAFLAFAFSHTASAQISASASNGQAYSFPTNLKLGSRGTDVKNLQILLNQDPDTRIATTGAGSPGKETLVFGPATARAVIKFQNKYKAETLTPAGLTKGTGFVGALTRKKLSSMGGGVTPTSVKTATSTALFARTLTPGMTGDDVKKLQTLLSMDGSIYPNRTISGTYDLGTVNAVKKFQDRHSLLTTAEKKTVSYGSVGTTTATKLISLYGNIQTGSTGIATTATVTTATTTTPTYSFSGGGGGGGGGTQTVTTSAPSPVNGGWSAYGTCSVVSCGLTSTSTRTCTNPTPSNGGAGCSGASSVICPAVACTTTTYTLSVTSSGNGTVTSSPAGISSCGTTCSHAFNSGISVILTANANTGYTFAGWTGICTGTSTCITTMSQARNVTATFSPVSATTFTITAPAGTNGTISPSGATTVTQGGNQTYTITPSSGYQLATLTVGGGPVTPVSSYTFTNVQGNTTITATFSVSSATLPSASQSSITLSNSWEYANGYNSTEISAVIRDANGNPLSNIPVTFTASGFRNTLVQPSSNTDANGRVTGSITSTLPENKTISISSPSGLGAVTAQIRMISNLGDMLTDLASRIGLNMEGNSDWNPSMVFNDAMKSSRPWGQPSTPCWGTPGPAVDANGWPMADAGVCFVSGGAGNILDISGTYALSFNGQATIGSALAGTTISGVNYNSGTNTTTANLVVTTPPLSAANLTLSFQNTRRLPSDTTPTGITNLKIIRPGKNPAEIFNPDFLARLSQSSFIRPMELASTNYQSSINWSERNLPTYATQSRGNRSRGPAWEYLILLANQTGKDLWINVPDNASDDYVLKLAQLFKYGSDNNGNPYSFAQGNPAWPPLNPSLKLYVEYSNEIWNSIFPQSTRSYNMANAQQWSAGRTYVPEWALGHSYVVGDQVINGGNLYRCSKDIPITGTGPWGTLANRVDGYGTWDYVSSAGSIASFAVSNGRLYQATKTISSSATPPSGTGTAISDGSGTWAHEFVFPANLNYNNTTNTYYLAWRLTGERTKQISDIFRSVYGNNVMGRTVIPVLGTQTAGAGVYGAPLEYLDAVYGQGNIYGNPPRPMNTYIYGVAGSTYWNINSLRSGVWPSTCVDLSTCTSWSSTASYSAGSYASSNGRLYQAGTAITGTSPGRAQPTALSSGIVDGNGTWNYIYTWGDNTATINQAFIDLTNEASQQRSASLYTTMITAAINYELMPIIYEGGLDTATAGHDSVIPIVTSLTFQNDSRFVDVTASNIRAWFSTGGSLFNYFTVASGYGRYGTWGLSNDIKDENTQKWQGYKQVRNSATLPAVIGGVAIPGTVTTGDTISNSGDTYTGAGRRYLRGDTSYVRYLVNVPATGNYNFATTVSCSPSNTGSIISILINGNLSANLPLGVQSVTIPLSSGLNAIHVKKASGSIAPTTCNAAFDPIVITPL